MLTTARDHQRAGRPTALLQQWSADTEDVQIVLRSQSALPAKRSTPFVVGAIALEMILRGGPIRKLLDA